VRYGGPGRLHCTKVGCLTDRWHLTVPQGQGKAPISYQNKRYSYLVHSFCLSALLKRVEVEWGEIPLGAVYRELYCVFSCTPRRHYSGMLLFGHDYGGLLRNISQHAIQNFESAKEDPSGLYYQSEDEDDDDEDDDEAMNEKDWLSLLPELGAPTLTGGLSDYHCDPKLDPFARLPLEILILILANVSTADLPNFRLASKQIASMSTIDRLPQSFWKSRFQPDHEFGFLWSRDDCWPLLACRLLYFALGLWMQDDTPRSTCLHGLRNCKRIWNLVKPIAKVIGQMRNRHMRLENHKEDACNTKIGVHLGRFISGDQSSQDRRYNQTRWLSWPKSCQSDSIQIAASSIEFNGQQYLCGLRFLSSSDSEHLEHDSHKNEISGAGMINPQSEEIINVRDLANIHQIEVYCNASGILGISFCSIETNGSIHRHSVGTVETRHSVIGDIVRCHDVGMAYLLGPEEKLIDGIVVEFDVHSLSSAASGLTFIQAIKLVSMRVTRDMLEDDLKDEYSKHDSDFNIFAKDVSPLELWIPSIPDTQVFRISPPVADCQPTFNLCLNVDLEQKKSLLEGISFVMSNYSGFIGLQVIYRGQKKELYRTFDIDNTNYLISTMAISGSAGEQITQVSVSSSINQRGKMAISAVKVSAPAWPSCNVQPSSEIDSKSHLGYSISMR
jgi:hypothetical protein